MPGRRSDPRLSSRPQLPRAHTTTPGPDNDARGSNSPRCGCRKLRPQPVRTVVDRVVLTDAAARRRRAPGTGRQGPRRAAAAGEHASGAADREPGRGARRARPNRRTAGRRGTRPGWLPAFTDRVGGDPTGQPRTMPGHDRAERAGRGPRLTVGATGLHVIKGPGVSEVRLLLRPARCARRPRRRRPR
jgi:hypothetical protein